MLVCQDLSYTYIRRPIFDKLCFKVSPTELLILKGPNGAGKSTCLNLLVGLKEIQTGSLAFTTTVGDRLDWPDYRQYLSYVGAETNGSYPKLTAMQNLMFWQRLYDGHSDKQCCLAMLERWGLGNPLVADHLSVDRFSTGMKRRLAFARLELLAKPIWVLDEPLFGLDQNGVEQFVDTLKRHLSQKGLAIMVSHDLSPFEHLNKTIVQLDGQSEQQSLSVDTRE